MNPIYFGASVSGLTLRDGQSTWCVEATLGPFNKKQYYPGDDMDQNVMPECGLECLAASLPMSECSFTNQTCLCLDQGFEKFVASCVTANCTIAEALTMKNISSTTCGLPVRNETVAINALRYSLFFVGLLFFAMRLASRAFRLAPWGHDDTTIVMSGVLIAGWFAGSILEERYGLGRDIWTLEPWKITVFLKITFVFEVLYTLTLGLIKTSILFLYLRIFLDPRFRRIVWATQVFNLLLVVSFIVSDFLQCQPISFMWESQDSDKTGHCFNINALAWAHSALNIALDFWMLYLPATQVWSLQMQVKKKIGILLMFGIGIFLALTSIIRIQTLVRFANTQNPTRDIYATVTWSYIEVTVGVMVACLPGARLFIARYVGAIRTRVGSRFSKSFSRSGNRMYLSQEDGTDEGNNAPPREGLGSPPVQKGPPAKYAGPSSSSQSAREDGESQVELVIMSMDDEREDHDERESQDVTV